jgi:hypothetical protein
MQSPGNTPTMISEEAQRSFTIQLIGYNVLIKRPLVKGSRSKGSPASDSGYLNLVDLATETVSIPSSF